MVDGAWKEATYQKKLTKPGPPSHVPRFWVWVSNLILFLDGISLILFITVLTLRCEGARLSMIYPPYPSDYPSIIIHLSNYLFDLDHVYIHLSNRRPLLPSFPGSSKKGPIIIKYFFLFVDEDVDSLRLLEREDPLLPLSASHPRISYIPCIPCSARVLDFALLHLLYCTMLNCSSFLPPEPF